MRTSAGPADGLDELIVPRGTKFCMASEPEPSMSSELILRANEETLLAARCCMTVKIRLGAVLITRWLLLTRLLQIHHLQTRDENIQLNIPIPIIL